jgi:hypothetical protein
MKSPYAQCPECDRLWKEYARAVADLSAVQNRYNAAAMVQDLPTFRHLDVDLQEIRQRRGRAAQELLNHQQREHGRTPKGRAAARNLPA